ncbi:hypothetical protein HY638_03305 [Candidatus Woesearchaeota archaeon]|nr:hypothetical protein [Candidatus Woesearchaeota archaeon]
MKRGRPVASEIRQHIVDILAVSKKGYGYDIFRTYRKIFPKVTSRSIYYHLKKGIETGEFRKGEVVKSEGNYSWGPTAEKIYYELGPNAKPSNDSRVADALKR